MIEARILLDSINPYGDRLTTWILKYPRFIHSELLTHRMLSKNSASSRAISIDKMIQKTIDEPAAPEFWGLNQKGMQAVIEANETEKEQAYKIWLEARDDAIKHAHRLLDMGFHKQIVNRLLEPWYHIVILMSATDLQNFFSLRAHDEAEPSFQKLAYSMLELYNKNEPKRVEFGDWHIPFGDKYCDTLSLEDQLKVCTARAARVSYENFEGEIDNKKDFALHDRLKDSGHWSPFEHAAQSHGEYKHIGNFKGWKQYRKFFNGENRRDSRVKHGA